MNTLLHTHLWTSQGHGNMVVGLWSRTGPQSNSTDEAIELKLDRMELQNRIIAKFLKSLQTKGRHPSVYRPTEGEMAEIHVDTGISAILDVTLTNTGTVSIQPQFSRLECAKVHFRWPRYTKNSPICVFR